MNNQQQKRTLAVETLLVHAGNVRHNVDSTALAIYPSTSYMADSPEQLDEIMAGTTEGFSYSRHANPTVEGLTQAMAQLEGAGTVIATASGMAAIDAALFAASLAPGDTILLSRDLYGASLNLAGKVWGQFGVKSFMEDFTNLEQLQATLEKLRPKVLLFEVLSNPLLKVVDVSAVIAMAHQVNCQVIVDSTFTTPLMIRPLALGADMVIHSATKYLGGHGDAMGGIVAAHERYKEALQQYIKLRGGILGPFEAWLIHRGLQTLAVRFERQCENAWQLASKLDKSGLLKTVYHPFLPNHPTFATAKRYLPSHLGGAVVTLELFGGRKAAYTFLKSLRVVRSATTIGDVYTLCLYPVLASHRNQSEAERLEMGITEGTLRIAVGLEHPDDLFVDLIQAIEKAAQAN
ncbi:trans-sulfuration enzyme family protein [Sulfoacidibacillus thermotolerans]|uniref:homocysteine desulfhydrase n=1 Tax=Sulfoacidibacillus thermotolerans TaxID=1765684 RepID=A0A2U3DC76_SULT2|nr:PLP-dependent aspartate aminotransferase family protein [Sulfoacidibacillus thermotolerans]PWI58878.1 methionine gamma-lyase [Sulfoacidibacillus thermotolerans]